MQISHGLQFLHIISVFWWPLLENCYKVPICSTLCWLSRCRSSTYTSYSGPTNNAFRSARQVQALVQSNASFIYFPTLAPFKKSFLRPPLVNLVRITLTPPRASLSYPFLSNLARAQCEKGTHSQSPLSLTLGQPFWFRCPNEWWEKRTLRHHHNHLSPSSKISAARTQKTLASVLLCFR